MKMLLSKIKNNPTNPRTITDGQYEKLKKSIQDFPEMLHLTPIVVDENRIALSGNMRLKALKELGYTEVEVIQAKDLTPAQKQEFIIKANTAYGSWEWDQLSAGWSTNLFADWGLSTPKSMQETTLTSTSTKANKGTIVRVKCANNEAAKELFARLVKEDYEVELK